MVRAVASEPDSLHQLAVRNPRAPPRVACRRRTTDARAARAASVCAVAGGRNRALHRPIRFLASQPGRRLLRHAARRQAPARRRLAPENPERRHQSLGPFRDLRRPPLGRATAARRFHQPRIARVATRAAGPRFTNTLRQTSSATGGSTSATASPAPANRRRVSVPPGRQEPPRHHAERGSGSPMPFAPAAVVRRQVAPAGPMRTQRITEKDIEARRIRFPSSAKRAFPAERGEVDVVLRGHPLTARWHPHYDRDQERSGVLKVGRQLLAAHVNPDEVLLGRAARQPRHALLDSKTIADSHSDAPNVIRLALELAPPRGLALRSGRLDVSVERVMRLLDSGELTEYQLGAARRGGRQASRDPRAHRQGLPVSRTWR